MLGTVHLFFWGDCSYSKFNVEAIFRSTMCICYTVHVPNSEGPLSEIPSTRAFCEFLVVGGGDGSDVGVKTDRFGENGM